MRATMKYMCENIQGAVLSFQQSDEITIILQDYKNLNTDAWFGYRTDKMCSIAASMATMAFNKFFWEESGEVIKNAHYEKISESYKKYVEILMNARQKGAMFDARCFNIPKEEVANLIYWRQLDATRNSIQMVGQANFSHSELQNKSCNQIQDMLFQEKGINWNDFPTHLKRGSCCVKSEATTTCAKTVDGEVITWAAERPHWEIDLEIPIFKEEGRQYINKRILYEEKEYCECLNIN
jgi:tRNA(His) 5'-end guanylyltransferase